MAGADPMPSLAGPVAPAGAVDIDGLMEPIAPQLREFERRLSESVADDLGPMAEAMHHIVKAGGKRLRPALVILSATLGAGHDERMYDLAQGIEFIHTATLVHDDLIDEAPTRRGVPSIHVALGPDPAIIIGDYYFAKGAHLLASIGDPSIDAMISRTVMSICMGELLQMTSERDYEQSLDDYYLKIERKTANLLSACCYCGGALGDLDDDHREALRRYGHEMGMAFQIADDLLDYTADAADIGKPVGADLRQGTVTLPLMYALEDREVGHLLRDVLASADGGDDHYRRVVDLVRRSSGVARAERRAHEFSDRARAELRAFTPSPWRRTLEGLCDYVVDRRL